MMDDVNTVTDTNNLVSTMEHDPFLSLLATFAGPKDFDLFEVAVLRHPVLEDNSGADVLHVEWHPSEDAVREAHDRVVSEINAGTLTYRTLDSYEFNTGMDLF